MMRKLLLLAIVSLEFLYPNAQEKVFEYAIPEYKKGAGKPLIIKDDNTNSYILTVANRTCIRRFLVAADGRFRNKLLQYTTSTSDLAEFQVSDTIAASLTKFYLTNNFIAGFRDGQFLIEMFQLPTHGYAFIETDLQSGASVMTDTLRLSTKEYLVSALHYGNELRIVTANKTNNINIYFKSKAKKITTKELRLDFENPIVVNEGEKEKHKIDHFFGTKEFAVLMNNQWYPISLSKYKSKTYIQKEHLYFTDNTDQRQSWLLDLNLIDLSLKLKRFDQTVVQGTNESSSSLLIDSTLITTATSKNKIVISLFDVMSNKLIRSHAIDETNFKTLVNSSITKIGDFWSSTEVHEIGFSDFIEKVKSNQLAISGYKENGQIYLTVGSPYTRVAKASTIFSVAFSLAATYFINAVPNTYGYGLFMFSESKTKSSVSFSMSVGLKDYEIGSLSKSFMIWDKMRIFSELRSVDPNSAALFNMNKYFYLSFFDWENRKYYVHRFKETPE